MSLPNASKCWAASRFPLSRVTTFRIGGPAELAAKPRSPADAADLVRWARGEGLPVRCVGMGSNLLVDDAGVRGLVLLLRGMDALWFEGPRVTAGAGVTNARILAEARVVERPGAECGFRYRGSDLADLVVTEVDLLLPGVDAEEFALECHAIYRRKMDTQPLELPSAGCVWKNPPGAVAGRLVDMAG